MCVHTSVYTCACVSWEGGGDRNSCAEVEGTFRVGGISQREVGERRPRVLGLLSGVSESAGLRGKVSGMALERGSSQKPLFLSN